MLLKGCKATGRHRSFIPIYVRSSFSIIVSITAALLEWTAFSKYQVFTLFYRNISLEECFCKSSGNPLRFIHQNSFKIYSFIFSNGQWIYYLYVELSISISCCEFGETGISFRLASRSSAVYMFLLFVIRVQIFVVWTLSVTICILSTSKINCTP